MRLVALTGGIGSGKSTVSAVLAARGAVIVDADAIVKELQQAGAPLLERLAERFGPGIIGADGELDRPALAAIAFNDDTALQDLNAIVHPAVREEMARRIDAEASSDRIVVLDTPLLNVKPGRDFAGVIVVDVPTDIAVDRLVAYRAMEEADARARIGKQITREERVAGADWVIDNSGDLAALEPQIDELWAWLQTLPASEPAASA